MAESPETRASLLIRLAEPSDQAAWSDFVRIYEPVVMRLAMRRGMQACDAQDLCQEVMTRVAQSIAKWNPQRERGSFRSWLVTVTRNLVIDHFRKQLRRPGLISEMALDAVDAPAALPSEFEREEERQIFLWAAEKARENFTQSTWLAFWMTCVDGQSPQAVAQRLELSVGAVYIARSRVMARLRDIVQSAECSESITKRFSGEPS